MIRAFLDFLFPKECHLCGTLLQGDEKYICTICESRLPRTHYHHYWHTPGAMNPMEHRLAGMVPFEHASASFFYQRETDIATLVHDFKYRKFPGLARFLGQTAGREFQFAGLLSDIDALLPVPMHWTKRTRRGYNQTELIAKGMSDVCGVPVADNLKAVRPHVTQTSLSEEQRRHNLTGIFQLVHPETLPGKRIAIIDDICTTGSTLLAAADAALEEIPDLKITFLTLCVTS